MNRIYYNISRNGKFVFRTDEILQMDLPNELEETLCKKFPAEEGYRVTKSQAPNVWSSTDLHNRTAEQEAEDANLRG